MHAEFIPEPAPAPSPADIAWAVKAYHGDGRKIGYIASVLGVAPKVAFRIVKKAKQPRKLKLELPMEAAPVKSSMRAAAEKAFAELVGEINADKFPQDALAREKPKADEQHDAIKAEQRAHRRRRFLLACRHARHWGMIWFLTRKRMSGRSLRVIYGDALIWATGGGIDDTID